MRPQRAAQAERVIHQGAITIVSLVVAAKAETWQPSLPRSLLDASFAEKTKRVTTPNRIRL